MICIKFDQKIKNLNFGLMGIFQSHFPSLAYPFLPSSAIKYTYLIVYFIPVSCPSRRPSVVATMPSSVTWPDRCIFFLLYPFGYHFKINLISFDLID